MAECIELPLAATVYVKAYLECWHGGVRLDNVSQSLAIGN